MTKFDEICMGIKILCALSMTVLVIFSIVYAIATNCVHGCGS